MADAITRYGQRGTPLRALMLGRWGPNVWHVSLESAMATLQKLEETSRLQLLRPGVQPLSNPQIEVLRQTVGARW